MSVRLLEKIACDEILYKDNAICSSGQTYKCQTLTPLLLVFIYERTYLCFCCCRRHCLNVAVDISLLCCYGLLKILEEFEKFVRHHRNMSMCRIHDCVRINSLIKIKCCLNVQYRYITKDLCHFLRCCFFSSLTIQTIDTA